MTKYNKYLPIFITIHYTIHILFAVDTVTLKDKNNVFGKCPCALTFKSQLVSYIIWCLTWHLFQQSTQRYKCYQCFYFRTNEIEFDHFEVIRTSGGYKLNIENQVKCICCIMSLRMNERYWIICMNIYHVAGIAVVIIRLSLPYT